VAAILSKRAQEHESSNDGQEEEEEEEEKEEVPSITLTIINIHPSHVVDARFYLRREMQAAENAGAKIVIKVRSISTQVL